MSINFVTRFQTALATGSAIVSDGMQAWFAPRPSAAAQNQQQLMQALARERIQAENANRALRASQARLLAVLNSVQDGVITIDKSGIIQSFNQSAERIFGYTSEQVVGKNVNMLMPQPARSQHDDQLSRHAETGTPSVTGGVRETTGMRKDSSQFPIELQVNQALVDGEVLFTGSVRDITARKQADEQLRIAAITFEAQQSIFITDAECRILRANKTFLAETGFAEEDLVGRTPRMLQAGVHDTSFYRTMRESLARTGSWQGEITGLRKNGETYPKWLTISAVRNDAGAVSHYVSTHVDITERKRMEEEVSQLAFYDPLTRLANRRLLTDRLRQAQAASKRSGLYGALIFIDLDNFKPLNDSHGHEVGDTLLKEAASRLKACVREMDTVARFGGDEFVVILSALHADQASSVAQAELIARKIGSSLSESYALVRRRAQQAESTIRHQCTASIGVTLFVRDELDPDEILKCADMAMYDAKREGRNQTRFYNEPNRPLALIAALTRRELHVASHSRLQAPVRIRAHSSTSRAFATTS